ncbi:MAG TPA: right-handed parallel beta-helix repeat-containing protein, partial [Clostridia bacterium]|nr:right-handed parallel beta-helix repeat-containing protein [Clostridia bacterium]
MFNFKKAKILFLIFIFAFSALGIWDMLAGIPVKAAGTTYYVSTSGNDNNDGLSTSTPWRTLGKVSSITFSPGDQILFKCGDTWTGETLSLNASGASSSNWVYVSSYGDGSQGRPKIQPGADTRYAVLIHNDGLQERNAGWNIQNLEISYARTGIGVIDERAKDSGIISNSPDYDSYILGGLWVENCYIHHITGNGDNLPPWPDSYSSGIRVMSYESWLYNVTIKNTTIEYCDFAVQMAKVRYFMMDNVDANYSGYEGFDFHIVRNGTIQNCSVLNTGNPGKPSGTAALEFNNTCQDIVVNNNELAYTISPNQPDGVGIDFEGMDYKIKVINNYIHDNAGSPFMFMPYISHHIIIKNNRLVNNGSDYDWHDEPSGLVIGWQPEVYADITFADNVIVKNRSNQTLYRIGDTSTNNPPQNFTVYNNTVYEPGSTPSQPSPIPVPGDPSVSDVIHSWEFNSGTEGWWGNNVSDFGASGGSLTFSSGSGDQYIMSGDNINVDVCYHQFLKIRLKNNTGNTKASVYFLTQNESDWGWLDSKHKTFNINPNSDYTEYVIDLTVTRGWNGYLKQLRINPFIDGYSGSMQIDYIRICKEGGVSPTPTPTPTATPSGDKLSGTAFGTEPAYAPGREYDKASDGNTSTYFDYYTGNGGYTGIDLGA